MHSSVNLIGAYLKLSIQLLKRDTFLKVAHMNKVLMASQQDEEITERMIKSIMPSIMPLANKMESSGRPGSVHISEDTYERIKGFNYNLEPGELYSGKKTYFCVKETRKETVAEAMPKSLEKKSPKSFN